MKLRAKLALLRLSMMGPSLAIIADKVAHTFGICLGH